MYAEVMIEDPSGARGVVKLVYPADANPAAGKVSVLSPLVNALLGSRAGWTVNFATPVGGRRVHVAEVLFQPEAAEQYDL